MNRGTRILLVEDDRSIAGFVEPELQHLGFHVSCRFDGVAGLEKAQAFSPALIILDIMLPKLDGVGVLKRLRQRGSRVPVIMLTARDTTLDKVHSLDLGADDYLTKPFDIEELLARIRALLRRAEGEEILRVAGLEIKHPHPRGAAGGWEIETDGPRVRAAPSFMARNPRQVLSREFLLSRVWDEDFCLTTNLVNVYVSYLRKKVDAPGENKLIRTVRGAGYALREA